MKCNYERRKQAPQQEKENETMLFAPFRLAEWRIEEMTGYHPITTFYTDFSIADHFGKEAVLDTYNRAMKEWKSNYKYLTELNMVVNWKSCEHYEKGNEALCKLYTELHYECRDYALNNLKGKELSYYLRATD